MDLYGREIALEGSKSGLFGDGGLPSADQTLARVSDRKLDNDMLEMWAWKMHFLESEGPLMGMW